MTTRAFMRTDPRKEPYSGSMSELACFRRLRTSSSPRYQPFDANPDQTTDWHLAESNRFCELFDELLSTQKMFEVIPPNHAVEMSELLGTQRFDRVHSCGTCRRHS
jgi:hypothetical protein